MFAESATLPIGTLMTIGGAVATALVTAVGVLWRQTLTHNDQLTKRAEKLEEKNGEFVGTLLSVKEEIGELRGRQAGIEETCAITMNTVREAINEGES